MSEHDRNPDEAETARLRELLDRAAPEHPDTDHRSRMTALAGRLVPWVRWLR